MSRCLNVWNNGRAALFCIQEKKQIKTSKTGEVTELQHKTQI